MPEHELPTPVQLSSENPWPGLRAFTEKDSDFFFGREREVADLLELVQQAPAGVLYGQSGLGKTSLVQAGLFPELKKLDFLPFRVRFDHSEHAPPLAEQIKDELTKELDRAGVQGPRPTAEETLWEYFHRRDLDLWGSGNRLLKPLIVLDQFEEVFTLGQRNERAATRVAQFAADLESVLEHRAPPAVRERLDENPDEALRYDLRRQGGSFLVSLREDFLGYLDSWCRRIPSLLSVSNRFRLQAMTGTQALEVVKRGGRELVDDAVARDIVDFVADARSRVAPALLCVVLEELNHRRILHGESHITAEFLSGERGKIIQDFYERSFKGIDPKVREWVEDRLLTTGGHRQPAALEDALTENIPESVFYDLENRRLLHRAEREGVVWLELTHDLLCDPASRSRAEREQRLQAEEALERQAVYKRELQKSRRLAGVFAALLVVAVVACGLSIYSYLNAKRLAIVAQQSADKAKQSETKSEDMYRSAADIAGDLSKSIVSNTWVPVSMVEEAILNAQKSYGKLGSQPGNPKDLEAYAGIPHARFLASAAEALYEGGHFTEGLKQSSDASAVLDNLDAAGSADPNGKIARAEILYEQGRGLLELNQLEEAKTDFENALKLVPAHPDPNEREDESRVFILSHIGLGRVYFNPCTQPVAMNHFRTALERAKYSAGRTAAKVPVDRDERDEARFLEVRSWLWLGRSQWIPADTQRSFSAAETVLQNAEQELPSNPRWKELSGELAYEQANAAYSLDQPDLALSRLGQVDGYFQELRNRDPLNWQWQLELAKNQHAMGEVYINLKEWDLAERSLDQSKQAATELLQQDNRSQSTWTDANSLSASNLESRSTVPAYRFLEAGKQPGTQQDFESSFPSLSQAESILQAIQSSAPPDLKCPVELAEIANYRGLIHYVQGLLAYEDSQTVDNNLKQIKLYTAALADASQGLKMIQAIEQRPSQSKSSPSPSLRRAKAQIYDELAFVQDELKDEAGNVVANRKNSIATYREVVHLAPTAKNYKSLSEEMKYLGDFYAGKKNYAQSLSQYEQAMIYLDKAIAMANQERGRLAPRGQQYAVTDKDAIYAALAEVDIARGNLHRAVEDLTHSLDTIGHAVRADYTNQEYINGWDNRIKTLTTIQTNLQNPTPPAPYNGLSDADKKALLAQVDSLVHRPPPSSLLAGGAGVWPLPPLYAGAWRTLASSEYAPEGVLQELAATRKDLTADQVLGIRSQSLDFYGDGRLYEIAVKGMPGTLFYMRRGKDWVQVNGSADAILQMNKKSPPRLDTVGSATAYLRFYLGTVQNTDLGADLCQKSSPPYSTTKIPPVAVGLFSLLDQGEDVAWLDSATSQQRTETAKKIEPLQVDESASHEWQAKGTVECGGTLYDASFQLSRNGRLVAAQSDQRDSNLPVKIQFFSIDGVRKQGTMEDMLLDALKRNPGDETAAQGLIRIYDANKQYDKEAPLLLDKLKRNPANEMALRNLQYIYSISKNWKGAVQAEENWITQLQSRKLDADFTTEDLKSDLIEAYTYLAWNQLLARNFAGALASSDAGMKLDPSNLELASRRAHALLFLNRVPEADAIYMSNRGKKIDWRGSWEQVILSDFDTFEKNGLSSPEMARLRTLLSAKPATSPAPPAPGSSPPKNR